MTFITVRCLHCHSEQIVKRGKTRRGTQRYLCQNTACTTGSFLLDYTTWRVIAYEGERGIEDKKTGLCRATLVSPFTAIACFYQLRGSPEKALTPAGQSCLDSP